MIRSWWDQLLIIYIPSLNVPFIYVGKGWKIENNLGIF